VKAAKETITPAVAKELLATVQKNRKPKRSQIEKYVADMREGRWAFTGEPILISTEGEMLDGQNRCLAIVEYGKPIEFMVIRGIEPEAKMQMNQGDSRTGADAVHMAGAEKNIHVASAIAKFMFQIPDLTIPTTEMLSAVKKRMSGPAVGEFYAAHKDEIDNAASHTSGLASSGVRGGPAAIGYSWILFSRIDRQQCYEFFESIKGVLFTGEHDPRRAIYNRLDGMARRDQLPSDAKLRVGALSLFCRGWNLWRTGEGTDSLPFFVVGGPTGRIPEIGELK
jgi:hypothetical protein